MNTREPTKGASTLAATCPICGDSFLLEDFCPKDGVKLTQTQSDPMIGSYFAERFQIISKLGAGGMGSVYKARHLLMDKIVALKVLEKVDAESARRFQMEAKLACQLQHPNIINVSDFGITADGQPYLVMDYLEGQSLGDIVGKERTIKFKRALKIFLQACDALNYAHKRRLIHRDLKPGNLMLVSDESGAEIVKLVDFGIAKRTHEETSSLALTRTGEVFGSPMYMSPEQCLGQKLDARSDIYSLGCVMYEVITGQTPFQASGLLQILNKHTSEDPLPFHQTNPSLQAVPAEFEKIVFTAMHRNLDLRYQSMLELWTDLQALEAKFNNNGGNLPISHSQPAPSTDQTSGRNNDWRTSQTQVSARDTGTQSGRGTASGTTAGRNTNPLPGSIWQDSTTVRTPMDQGASTGQQKWAEKDWSTGQDSSAAQEAPVRQDQTVGQDSSSAFLQSRNESVHNSGSSYPEKQQLKVAPPQSQSKMPLLIGGVVCAVIAIGAAATFYFMSVNNKHQASAQTDTSSPAQVADTAKWLKLKKEGDSEFKNGHIKSSLTLFQEAAANAQSADQHDPQLIALYNSLGRAYYEEGRYKDAEEALTKATSICEKDDKLDDSMAAAETKTILGSVLSSRGNFEKADKLFDRALVIARSNSDEENPDSAKSLAANNVLASALLARAGMHIKKKQPEAALIELNEALTKRKASLTALHNGGTKNKTALVQEQESVAEIENEIGRAYETESKFAAAKDAYKQAEKDAQASVGNHHPVYADSLCGLASIDSMQSHFAEAANQYEQAKVIRELYFGTHNLRTAEAVACLGILKTLQKGQFDDGIALLDEALSVRQELLGTDNPEVKKFAKRCDEIKHSRKSLPSP